MPSAIPQWIQDIETLISLLGFILTYLVFREVSEVRRSFMRRARLPEHMKLLKKYASALNTAITASSDEATLATEINSAQSVIKKIKPLLGSHCKSEAKKVIDEIGRKKQSITSEAINIYSMLQVFIRTLEGEIKDMRWE